MEKWIRSMPVKVAGLVLLCLLPIVFFVVRGWEERAERSLFSYTPKQGLFGQIKNSGDIVVLKDGSQLSGTFDRNTLLVEAPGDYGMDPSSIQMIAYTNEGGGAWEIIDYDGARYFVETIKPDILFRQNIPQADGMMVAATRTLNADNIDFILFRPIDTQDEEEYSAPIDSRDTEDDEETVKDAVTQLFHAQALPTIPDIAFIEVPKRLAIGILAPFAHNDEHLLALVDDIDLEEPEKSTSPSPLFKESIEELFVAGEDFEFNDHPQGTTPDGPEADTIKEMGDYIFAMEEQKAADDFVTFVDHDTEADTYVQESMPEEPYQLESPFEDGQEPDGEQQQEPYPLEIPSEEGQEPDGEQQQEPYPLEIPSEDGQEPDGEQQQEPEPPAQYNDATVPEETPNSPQPDIKAEAPRPPLRQTYLGMVYVVADRSDGQGFYIHPKKVTNQEYLRFVQAINYRPPSHWVKGQIPLGREDDPVVNVTYKDALLYSVWSGKRLPSLQELRRASREQEVLADLSEGHGEWTSSPAHDVSRSQGSPALIGARMCSLQSGSHIIYNKGDRHNLRNDDHDAHIGFRLASDGQ